MDFSTRCAAQGFDLCHPFHTNWYNERIEQEGLVETGQLETLPVTSRAFLVGNTKSIWPLFCQWLVQHYHDAYQDDEDIADGNSSSKDETTRQRAAIEKVVHMENPFDTFCDEQLTRILQDHYLSQTPPQPYEVFWAHGGRESCCANKITRTSRNDNGDTTETTTYPQKQQQHETIKDASFVVSMQRVAQVSGLCWHDDEGSKLCVHPQYGTWKAFRAVVVLLGDPNNNNDNGTCCASAVPPRLLTCPVPPEEMELAKKKMQVAIQQSAADGSGIDYGQDKMAETGKSLGKYLHHAVCDGSDWSLVSPSMRAWIDVRDCFSLGRDDFKYSDPQLLYHYTKDPGILRNELKRCLRV